MELNENSGIMSAQSTSKGHSSSISQDILLPMCNILPPNEIITKKYQPDVKPVIKLILNSQHQQQYSSNIIYKPPKIHNQQYKSYANTFNVFDTLGYYWANHINQVIYLKFNNQNYNSIRIKDKLYHFLSGLFVPLQYLYHDHKSHLKSNNFYQMFPNMKTCNYNEKITDSFSNNSKGCSKDPKFSSNYDSANLFAVIRKQPFQYDLILQNDINSKGNVQWFNFTVQFNEIGLYTFNIVNMTKSHSLHKKGMRVVCYSYNQNKVENQINQQKKTGAGWNRCGLQIAYSRSTITRQSSGFNDYYYCLSFSYRCKNRGDYVSFAYSYPYTGLDCQKFFNQFLNKKIIGQHMQMEKLIIGQSISGQSLVVYSITHRKLHHSTTKIRPSYFNMLIQNNKQMIEKRRSIKMNSNRIPFLMDDKICNKSEKSVIFMARQHSGETVSSYVLEGIVEFLMENSQYDILKKQYNFYVIPMLNVDGMKYGNYRTNLGGFDLNRVWRNPHPDYHKQIYQVKKFINEINKLAPISLIIDIHGHSKSLNSFFYGNPQKRSCYENPKFFPYLCSRRNKQISYDQSTFTIHENKKNSARVVLAQIYPKALVYTFQNSFYACNLDQLVEYTPNLYRQNGRQLIQTYLDYVKLSDKNCKLKQKWSNQIENIKNEKDQKQDDNKLQINDSGSDSEVQKQLLQFQKINQNQLIPHQNTKRNQIKKQQFHYRTNRKELNQKTMLLQQQKPLKQNIPVKQILQQNIKQQTNSEKNNSILSIFRIQNKENKILKPFLKMNNKNLQNKTTTSNLKQFSATLSNQKDMVNSSVMKRFLKTMGITIKNNLNNTINANRIKNI